MHKQIRVMLFSLLLFAAGSVGCDESRAPVYFGDEPTPDAPVALAAEFDATSTGNIAGRVTWQGNLPQVPPFRAPVSPLSEQPSGPRLLWPNPHAPVVDSKSHGVAGVVVFLRGVDPKRARPWDHAPVRVTVRSCQYHILQGDSDSNTGIVRRGDRVTIVSEDDRFQAVQARGAAFFTLTLPDRDVAHERSLTQSGVVELGSNAGQFWMRAHLFVSDHPYLTRTDSEGRFSLAQVPSGTYELACWLPDWREAARELDAETAQITRLTFRPALVKLQDVTVKSGGRPTVDFTVSADDFGH